MKHHFDKIILYKGFQMSEFSKYTQDNVFHFLPLNFNKRKFSVVYGIPQDSILKKMHNILKILCILFTFY